MNKKNILNELGKELETLMQSISDQIQSIPDKLYITDKDVKLAIIMSAHSFLAAQAVIYLSNNTNTSPVISGDIFINHIKEDIKNIKVINLQ